MQFLGSRRQHYLFWTVLTILSVFCHVRLLGQLRLSIDAVFSGLLALTGFIFTARTFITFKLNEAVYGTPTYRTYIESLRKDDPKREELYSPLKALDASLGNATGMCLLALALFAVVSFLPDYQSIALDDSTRVRSLSAVLASRRHCALALHSPATLLPVLVATVSNAALLYFLFVLHQVYRTSWSLNGNIKAIIAHWETEYNKTLKKP